MVWPAHAPIRYPEGEDGLARAGTHPLPGGGMVRTAHAPIRYPAGAAHLDRAGTHPLPGGGDRPGIRACTAHPTPYPDGTVHRAPAVPVLSQQPVRWSQRPPAAKAMSRHVKPTRRARANGKRPSSPTWPPLPLHVRPPQTYPAGTSHRERNERSRGSPLPATFPPSRTGI